MNANTLFHSCCLEILNNISKTKADYDYTNQNRNLDVIIKTLVQKLEKKDVYTQGHSKRVSEYSKQIARLLQLKEIEIQELGMAGLVHDIGKIEIHGDLLTKSERLTLTEFDTIKQHPEMGLTLLLPLHLPSNIVMGTLLHHKRYDLQGYPEQIRIDKLPLTAAIIGVADAFDAMTSERSYKKTMTKHDAMLELKRHSGTQFDPIIVDVMEELYYQKAI